jgi:hypothetical protein
VFELDSSVVATSIGCLAESGKEEFQALFGALH